MDAALATGADIVVHLDGDGQHDPKHIPSLLAPIFRGGADVVVGVRPLAQANENSRVRRRGNQLGSWVFRRIVKLPISDATSGYRAFSREALLTAECHVRVHVHARDADPLGANAPRRGRGRRPGAPAPERRVTDDALCRALRRSRRGTGVPNAAAFEPTLRFRSRSARDARPQRGAELVVRPRLPVGRNAPPRAPRSSADLRARASGFSCRG